MKYETKEIALKNVSKNTVVAKKQIQMINCMYGIGDKVSDMDLKNIELDYHRDNMSKAMSY